MPRPSPDPFVLEIHELARLIALAREWVLRGPPAAREEIRARRAGDRAGRRFAREAPGRPASATRPR